MHGGESPPRTHDLVQLLDLCAVRDLSIRRHHPDVMSLNVYAVLVRFPDLSANRMEASAAIGDPAAHPSGRPQAPWAVRIRLESLSRRTCWSCAASAAPRGRRRFECRLLRHALKAGRRTKHARRRCSVDRECPSGRKGVEAKRLRLSGEDASWEHGRTRPRRGPKELSSGKASGAAGVPIQAGEGVTRSPGPLSPALGSQRGRQKVGQDVERHEDRTSQAFAAAPVRRRGAEEGPASHARAADRLETVFPLALRPTAAIQSPGVPSPWGLAFQPFQRVPPSGDPPAGPACR